MHKILLVEDDPVIRQMIKKMLEQWGFQVVAVEDFMDVLTVFVREEPHLVLMDIGLPLFNGYHWCQEIRKISTVPIMFLSSRDQSMDIVMAINMGADDYVTKPIVERILTSRVTQQIKRGQTQRAPRANILTWGPLELDLSRHNFTISGKVVMLTNSEYQFLQLLMANPQRIFSREQILQAIGAFRGLKADHLVDSHASRLRKKIREAGGPELISVVRSVGFRLAPAQA